MIVFENDIVFYSFEFFDYTYIYEHVKSINNSGILMPSLLFYKLRIHTGGNILQYRGSSTKTFDGVSKHKQFAHNVVDNHGNTHVHKLYVTGQHLKFETDQLTYVHLLFSLTYQLLLFITYQCLLYMT